MTRAVHFLLIVAALLALALLVTHGVRGQGRCDHVLARGELSASPHEAAEGIASVGLFTVAARDEAHDYVMPVEGIAALVLRQCEGRRVEIVVRELPPLERIKR